MVIAAPMTQADLEAMMLIAKDYDGPIAIRYPRGRVQSSMPHTPAPISIGKGRCLRDGTKVAVLSMGAIGNTVAEAIKLLGDKANIAHYDMRWLKPMDSDILAEVTEKFDTIVTVEDGVINGGLGSAVAEYVSGVRSQKNRKECRVIRLGVNDQFVEHGSTQELYHLLKLDKEGICESLLQALEK
jgi:1-deoxy-D-xylulose-5-phosphate synthase